MRLYGGGRRRGEREARERGVLDLEPGLGRVAVADDEDDDDGDRGDDGEADAEAAREAAVRAEAAAALAVVAHGGSIEIGRPSARPDTKIARL